jgi:hypothetical protein
MENFVRKNSCACELTCGMTSPISYSLLHSHSHAHYLRTTHTHARIDALEISHTKTTKHALVLEHLIPRRPPLCPQAMMTTTREGRGNRHVRSRSLAVYSFRTNN